MTYRVENNKLMKKHVCLICNSEFETNRKDAQYCSPRCRQEAYRQRKIKKE